ncbi:MAG: CBS domain-containing protein [Anaerolineae bacterium]|nr:CBS domain-containing protein [Anaerolineae bacterium]
MRVPDIMTRNPVTIPSTSTVWQALEAMERASCHHLPVMSPQNHVVGVITARDCRLALRMPDVVREYWQEDELAKRLLVRTVMTTAPTVTTPDTSAKAAAQSMLHNYVSCLPVMIGETLVGIVTISDMLIAFTRMQSDD